MGNFQLPPFVSVDGEWMETCTRLYRYFEAVFKTSPPRQVRGRSLVFDKRIIEPPFEEGFWHIITSGKGEDRLFDPDRARKISWLDPMLNGAASGLTRWAYKEGDGSTKLYYWLEAEKYVLILIEKPKVVALVTAFHVNKGWLENDLAKRRTHGTAF